MGVYISIHALLAESDNSTMNLVTGTTKNFYPRSPCGERLKALFDTEVGIPFLSTLIDLVDSPVAKISIHALLAESDYVTIPTP